MSDKPKIADDALAAAASKLKHTNTEVHDKLPTKEDIEAEKAAK